MGSLQKIKGSLKVRKVEGSEGSGTVFIEADSLSFEELAEAQAMANKIIWEGRLVKEHFFNSLEEARKAFPSLRAHEERIQGRVRVVEVDGFDYSACTGKHVGNTKECGMIIVTHVSKSGKEYRIDFEVGEKALNTAVKLSMLCLSVSSILGAPIRNLEKTVLNMRAENEDLKKRLSAVTEDSVRKIIREPLDGTGLYAAILKGVDAKTVMKTIGGLICNENSVYVVGIQWSETCSIIVGSGNDRINASETIRELCAFFNGKGGGDQRIAIGSLPCSKFNEAFETVKRNIKNSLAKT